MPSREEIVRLIDVELALRDAQERERLEPIYDWYGPDCGCPAEERLPKGACPTHKRARANQRPPDGGDWTVWYVEAGRGFGKTETGAQWVRHRIETLPPGRRIALVAPTAGDCRDVMVDGPSGLLAICPPWNRPVYQPSKRRLVWPNGSRAILYSADEPERLRGPQHHDAWCDEIASWRDPSAYSMLKLGLRLKTPGRPDISPLTVITGTPKPLDWLRKIKKRAKTIVFRGSTYENQDNLDPEFYEDIVRDIEGTRLGRQELHAEDLVDTPGALWNSELLDEVRLHRSLLPDLTRIVVAIDPSVADPKTKRKAESDDDDTAECGITVGGMSYEDHPTLGWVAYGYLLADRSMKGHPVEWARAAVNAYREFGADLIVAEVNNGGALVSSNIQSVDSSVPVKCLHASRGKATRAEPISSLYEQRRVFHVRDDRTEGSGFEKLENQLCTWVPGMKSPDRLDSLVWLFTELLLEGAPLTTGPNPMTGYRG